MPKTIPTNSKRRRGAKSASSASTTSAFSVSRPAGLITAREAVRRLGVKPSTLYAYVSRGLLRSVGVQSSRERRYYADDVERLKRLRRNGRRTAVPRGPFDSLAPMLDSAICLVDNGRLYYRGIDAAELADCVTLEETARLLWQTEAAHPFYPPDASFRLQERLKDLAPALGPTERARTILVGLATEDVGALDVSPEAVLRSGGRLVSAVASALTGTTIAGMPIHLQLATAWNLDAQGADLIRRCLVLAADHELNTSTFVARCVASTAASPYAAVIAALGALAGPRHGGQTSHVENLLRDLINAQDVMGAFTARLQRDGIPGFGGESIPGFGHPLYPGGDVRATNILGTLEQMKLSRRSSILLKMGEQIFDRIGRRPNFDFSLATVAVVLDLPRGTGLGLFLLGRTVGWIAHAIEQYSTQALIRPRARYVGTLPLPEDADRHRI